ncbi:MAG: 2-amino-4-hydroxy-6-hydroxymethyldihydropteridine diphosphokinase [Chloroflexi bacterium]|nr:2-amino-4-hydroxy-6-hydroxymethyldihydropteridine diphosphokinase [Chloroflexota bacterium]
MAGDTTVYLALGSNLGDRRQNLIAALDGLAPDVRVEAVSSLYETDPVGPPDQQDYYNAVCRARTSLQPRELLAVVKQVERDVGRTEGPRWGPRLIDIDILLCGDVIVDEPELHVPHREMAKRAFVLVPLAELAADLTHPAEDKTTIGELLANVDASGVRLLADAGWERP